MTTVQSPAEPLLLSAREVAKLLGVSVNTIFRLSSQGKFPPPLRIGRLKKWQRSALAAWMESDQHGQDR